MKVLKKLLVSVAIILAIVLVAVVVLGCFLFIPDTLGVEKDELSRAYGTVLADVDGITTKNPRYIDLAFLGSHDSFSSLITPDGQPDEQAPAALGVVLPLIKNFAWRFALTQQVGIYDQIMQGARFFQLKVTVYQGEWYTSHSLLSGTLETHIKEILRYLTSEQANGETVGVLFQPVYLGTKTYAEMHEYISTVTYNGKSLYDFVRYDAVDVFHKGTGEVKISDLRYNDLTENGTKPGVVLFDRRDNNYKPTWEGSFDAFPYSFDLDSNAIHVWHNSSSPKKLTQGIVDTAAAIKANPAANDLLRINQTQAALATGSIIDLYCDITSGSLVKIAQKHNLSLVERKDFNDILSTMPVFQVDYLTSTYGDFNQRANALIRQYNENLCKAA